MAQLAESERTIWELVAQVSKLREENARLKAAEVDYRSAAVGFWSLLAHARKYTWAHELPVSEYLEKFDRIADEMASALPENKAESAAAEPGSAG